MICQCRAAEVFSVGGRMAITFPRIEAWDGARDVASFPADKDGARIGCAISLEALQDNHGGAGGDPIACFRSNRPAIEAKAERLIRQGRFESDGSMASLSALGRGIDAGVRHGHDGHDACLDSDCRQPVSTGGVPAARIPAYSSGCRDHNSCR